MPGVDPATPMDRLSGWFPAAGLVIGGLTGGLFWLAAGFLTLPLPVALWVTVIGEMLLTGALHPDGLADTADGLAGSTVQRRLEIMKDPRLGAYGGIALLLSLGGRAAMLAAIAPAAAPALLAVIHGAARWAPVWALGRYPYARPGGGTGAAFSGAGPRQLLQASLTVAAAGWLLGSLTGRPVVLVAAAAALLGGLLTARFLASRLGGVTGDACGAMAEIGLLAALLVAAAFP